jgi:hypothetical protein
MVTSHAVCERDRDVSRRPLQQSTGVVEAVVCFQARQLQLSPDGRKREDDGLHG